MVFIVRGALAAMFGCFALFCGPTDVESLIAFASVFLLFMADKISLAKSVR